MSFLKKEIKTQKNKQASFDIETVIYFVLLNLMLIFNANIFLKHSKFWLVKIRTEVNLLSYTSKK